MVPIFMSERPNERRWPWQKTDDIVETIPLEKRNFKEILGKLQTAFSVKSARIAILISFISFLAYFLIPVLPLLFVRELGWSQEKFNATKGGLMLIVGFFGYMVGGQLGKRFGGRKVAICSIMLGALITASWG